MGLDEVVDLLDQHVFILHSAIHGEEGSTDADHGVAAQEILAEQDLIDFLFIKPDGTVLRLRRLTGHAGQGIVKVQSFFLLEIIVAVDPPASTIQGIGL